MQAVDEQTLLAIAIANVALALGGTLSDWVRGRLDLLDCKHVFLLFLALTFGVWPAWVLLAGHERFDGIEISMLTWNGQWAAGALLLGTLAIVCFQAGYYLAPRSLVRMARAVIQSSPDISPPSLRVAALLLGSIGMLAAILFIKMAGGMEYIANIDAFRTTRLTGFGPLLLALGFLSVGFLGMLDGALLKRGSFLKWVPALAMGVLGAALTLLCGSRHTFLLIVGTGLVFFNYRIRRVRLTPKFALMIVLFTALNWLYSDFRARSQDRDEGEPWSEVAWRGFFKRFIGAESLARVLGEHGYDQPHLGLRPVLEGIAYSVIPRSLAPDKPPVLGWTANTIFYADVFNEADSSSGSAPLGAVGDLYWIGGRTGVIVGFLLLGALARLAYQLALAAAQSRIALLAYTHVFTFFLFAAEDIKLHSIYAFHRLLFIVLPLIVLAGCFAPYRRWRLRPKVGERPLSEAGTS